jgi:signal transduction histidine kinase
MFEDKRVGINNRLAQRSGFGIIIGLLVVSTLMAWGIQESFSVRSYQIHRRFMQEQELLSNLRRTLWEAGVAVRDFYLNPVPNREELQSRLNALSKESDAGLTELAKVTTHGEQVIHLRLRFIELWQSTTRAASEDWAPEERFEFLQKEIVPRRDEAGRVLREIEKANHSSLTDSEVEMRDTRAGAARRLLAILGACLFCGVVIAWFSIRHAEQLEREAARRFREVLDAKRQLEELSARLMEVQEEERTRLSRELHDEIVQNLAVLKMEIVQAQNLTNDRVPEAADPLSRARLLAEETVRSVRDISLLLRPSLLDDLGLGPALQWQTEEFTRRTGVPCVLEESDLSDDLPESVKTCVYRVAQEALRNCEKHSLASSVVVRVSQTDDELEMIIEDDGRGFTRNPRKPANLGVLGMRERAYALGGTLETSNRPEGGASVTLTIPLAPVPQHQPTGAHA